MVRTRSRSITGGSPAAPVDSFVPPAAPSARSADRALVQHATLDRGSDQVKAFYVRLDEKDPLDRAHGLRLAHLVDYVGRVLEHKVVEALVLEECRLL